MDRSNLDTYLEMIRNYGPQSTPDTFKSANEQLAYYINAYNALVFEGVLSRGPEQVSVWSGFISGLAFFVRMDITLDGIVTNLRALENKVIRDKFRDPRIHAALVCASISCPKLNKEPYQGSILDQQLNNAMIEFVGSGKHIQVDSENGIVKISEIFEWFEEDFIEFEKSQDNHAPTLIDYINRFRSDDRKIDRNYEIEYLSYDKNINSQTR